MCDDCKVLSANLDRATARVLELETALRDERAESDAWRAKARAKGEGARQKGQQLAQRDKQITELQLASAGLINQRNRLVARVAELEAREGARLTQAKADLVEGRECINGRCHWGREDSRALEYDGRCLYCRIDELEGKLAVAEAALVKIRDDPYASAHQVAAAALESTGTREARIVRAAERVAAVYPEDNQLCIICGPDGERPKPRREQCEVRDE